MSMYGDWDDIYLVHDDDDEIIGASTVLWKP